MTEITTLKEVTGFTFCVIYIGQDGGDAAAQHVMDRGPVPQEVPGHPLRVPENADVHLCLRLLS